MDVRHLRTFHRCRVMRSTRSLHLRKKDVTLEKSGTQGRHRLMGTCTREKWGRGAGDEKKDGGTSTTTTSRCARSACCVNIAVRTLLRNSCERTAAEVKEKSGFGTAANGTIRDGFGSRCLGVKGMTTIRKNRRRKKVQKKTHKFRAVRL